MRWLLGVLSLSVAVTCSQGAGTEGTVTASLQSVLALPEADRCYQRLLYHPGPKTLSEEFDSVARLMANSLSREGELQAPVRVNPNIWRVDLRWYDWEPETWEKFADLDNYFHAKVTKYVYTRNSKGKRIRSRRGITVHLAEGPIAKLAAETQSNVPIVRADWWLVQVCRQLSLRNKQTGVGYYDWLRIKKRADYFALAKVRLQDTRNLRLDRLAAIAKSGVSEQNRQIDYEPTLTGSLWFTLDTNDGQGAGNAVRNLRRGDYIHQAEEHYLPLPNGLPVLFLGNAAGERQDSAPDFIGPDKTSLSNDGRIHIFKSCWSCHAGNVLQPLDDWARKNYTVGRLALQVPVDFANLKKDKQFELYQTLRRQWLTNINEPLNAQRLAYQHKVIEATGQTAAEMSKRLVRAFHAYADTPVTMDQAALEWFTTPQELRKSFIAYAVAKGTIDSQLGGLLGTMKIIDGKIDFLLNSRSEPIPRLHFEELYPLGKKVLALDIRD